MRLRPSTRRLHDPELDRFDRGCVELTHDGRVCGWVATRLLAYRTPWRPLTTRDWVWLLVIWEDGSRELPCEEYEPWAYVTELLHARFEWGGVTYDARWLAAEESFRMWQVLGVTEADF